MTPKTVIKGIKYQVFFVFIVIFLFLLLYENYLLQQKKKPIVPVLMFHSVDEQGPSNKDEDGLVITPQRLKEDLSYLKLKGYKFIDCKQLINLCNNTYNNDFSGKNIAITFDDGYRNNYTNAYPILKQEDVKAIINIIVYYVERYDAAIPNRYLLWEYINEMVSSGIIQIGSHSYNSHHYVQLENKLGPMLSERKRTYGILETQNQFEKRAENDLTKSINFIKQRTGQFPEVITFPYGVAHPKVKQIAEKLGFKIQMGIKPGVNIKLEDLKDLKRITVKHSYTPEQLEKKIRFYSGVRFLLP